jgi:hypothetical protein
MEKIETILTDCIKEIKTGRATLAECLERYPDKRHELGPLLKLALNIREPAGIKLDSADRQDIKAGLMDKIQSDENKKARSSTGFFGFGFLPQAAWARVAVSVVAIVIVLSIITGGTAYASRESLPGDWLYPVKTATEDARIFFARGAAAKAELNLEFAQKRLEEMRKLADTDEAGTESSLNGYRDRLEAADRQIRSLSDTTVLSGLLDASIEDMQVQMNLCDAIIDADPGYAGPAQEAGNLNISKQLALLEILAEQNALQAAQTNLNLMQNRLQRASARAAAGQFQTMQKVLLQYQDCSRFGEQVLANVQSSGSQAVEIETISSQALSGFLDTIDNISRQAPGEYQNTIRECRQVTQQFQTQARYRYQHGIPDMDTEGLHSGNGQESPVSPDEAPSVTPEVPASGDAGDIAPDANGNASTGNGVDAGNGNEITTSIPPGEPAPGNSETTGNENDQSGGENPGQGPGSSEGQNTPTPPPGGESPGNDSGQGTEAPGPGDENNNGQHPAPPDSGDGPGPGDNNRP